MSEIRAKSQKYFYVEMEICDSDLAQFIRDRPRRPNEPLIPQQTVWEIMNAVANAVAFVHQQNFTICDLRPSKGILWLFRSSVLP